MYNILLQATTNAPLPQPATEQNVPVETKPSPPPSAKSSDVPVETKPSPPPSAKPSAATPQKPTPPKPTPPKAPAKSTFKPTTKPKPTPPKAPAKPTFKPTTKPKPTPPKTNRPKPTPAKPTPSKAPAKPTFKPTTKPAPKPTPTQPATNQTVNPVEEGFDDVDLDVELTENEKGDLKDFCGVALGGSTINMTDLEEALGKAGQVCDKIIATVEESSITSGDVEQLLLEVGAVVNFKRRHVYKQQGGE
ncbi:hypothetical protein DPMN_024581 [Dreissena polymorpha]|uniref:Uncharacterized protein n=1 Tax=Dreissena polymorpha TaxID=45954 RepID=A0A9D4RCF8_DREPO|nr:hypothetical protein DPMN_024581 [Dreissena polymorpha]